MPNDIANSDLVELRREHIIFGKNLWFKDKAVEYRTKFHCWHWLG